MPFYKANLADVSCLQTWTTQIIQPIQNVITAVPLPSWIKPAVPANPAVVTTTHRTLGLAALGPGVLRPASASASSRRARDCPSRSARVEHRCTTHTHVTHCFFFLWGLYTLALVILNQPSDGKTRQIYRLHVCIGVQSSTLGQSVLQGLQSR